MRRRPEEKPINEQVELRQRIAELEKKIGEMKKQGK